MADRGPPNILWYCSDQQRYDTVAAFGNPHIRTPTVDRLVAEGVGFDHAFAQSPICTPSRACFLTGRYPATTHAHRNGAARFPDHETLVTRLFADAGYDCGLVGKLHLAAAFNGTEPRTDDGYRSYCWSHHPGPEGPSVNAYHDWLRDEKGVDPIKLFGSLSGFCGPGVPAELHQTTWCTEMAIRFLERPRRQPWLLSVDPFAPHPPFDPAPEYLAEVNPADLPPPLFREADILRQEMFAGVPQQSMTAVDPRGPMPDLSRHPDAHNRLRWAHRPPSSFDGRQVKAAYYAMIEHIDFEFGRLLSALDALGQLDNTIILYHSDHGELLGDHGLIYKGCRFFDSLVRVPLVFRWPGHIMCGGVSRALVELIDIAPTLLDAAGLPVPSSMQGLSLMPLMTGQVEFDEHRPNVVSQYNNSLGSAAIPDPVHATMYRDRRYKHVVYHGLNVGELFDLQEDPGEFDNLWFDETEGSLRYRLLLAHFDALMATSDAGIERVAMG